MELAAIVSFGSDKGISFFLLHEIHTTPYPHPAAHPTPHPPIYLDFLQRIPVLFGVIHNKETLICFGQAEGQKDQAGRTNLTGPFLGMMRNCLILILRSKIINRENTNLLSCYVYLVSVR